MGESHSGRGSSASTTRRNFLAAMGSAAWVAAYGVPGLDWLRATAAAEQAKTPVNPFALGWLMQSSDLVKGADAATFERVPIVDDGPTAKDRNGSFNYAKRVKR